MNPKRFLVIAGSTLVTLGGLGVLGYLQRISDAALFRPPWWINWVHLGVGAAAFAIAASGTGRLQAAIVLFPAAVGTTMGLAGLLFGGFAAERFKVPDLADPSEHLAHLTVGLMALWAWRGRSLSAPGTFSTILE